MAKDERKAPGNGRNERVLHTRLPETLDDELRAKARELGVSVSNLVRNILRNTVSLVEDIVEDTTNAAQAAWAEQLEGLRHRAPRVRSRRAPPAPLGWQEITLSLNAVCEQCNGILSKGKVAAVAVHRGDGPRTIICTGCRTKLSEQE